MKRQLTTPLIAQLFKHGERLGCIFVHPIEMRAQGPTSVGIGFLQGALHACFNVHSTPAITVLGHAVYGCIQIAFSRAYFIDHESFVDMHMQIDEGRQQYLRFR